MTLQCTKDAQFILVVARDATLPNLDLETISFLEKGQSCEPVGITSAFVIYQFPVTACGTLMTVRLATHFSIYSNLYLIVSDSNKDWCSANLLQEEPGYIIYENRMSSSYEVAIGPNGIITRDSSYEYVGLYLFACICSKYSDSFLVSRRWTNHEFSTAD